MAIGMIGVGVLLLTLGPDYQWLAGVLIGLGLNHGLYAIDYLRVKQARKLIPGAQVRWKSKVDKVFVGQIKEKEWTVTMQEFKLHVIDTDGTAWWIWEHELV